jgi:hypothetical protein
VAERLELMLFNEKPLIGGMKVYPSAGKNGGKGGTFPEAAIRERIREEVHQKNASAVYTVPEAYPPESILRE